MGYGGSQIPRESLTRDDLVHPGPAALALAGVRVEIKLADLRAARVGNPEEAYVRVPGFGLVRCNPDSVKGSDQAEHTFEDLRLGKVPLDFLIGERVAFRAQFFGSERDIPGTQVLQSELGAGEFFQLGVVLARERQRPGGEVVQEIEHG